MPAFSLVYNPLPLTLQLQLVYIAPLPMYYYIPKLRCQVLAPIIFGASLLGYYLTRRLRKHVKAHVAEIIGGVILILLGVKILLGY